MAWHKIGSVEKIVPGTRRIVTIAGRSIGIFNVHGAFYAVKNSCIHNQAPVCLGELSGAYLPSAPDEYIWGLEGQVLRCPWHGWEFDVATGRSLFDPETRLATYPVRIENDEIFIEVGGKIR